MRLRALPTLALLLAAAASHADTAKIPDPSRCTVPSFVDVVGTDAGTVDRAGWVTLVIRDIANNPEPGFEVVLDFSACTDLQLCPVSLPGVDVDCATRTVRATTGLDGSVTFAVAGAGRNCGAAPGCGAGSVRILAEGVILKFATATIADENGAVSIPGLEPTDLSALLRDIGSGLYFGRSDLDHDGAVGVGDLLVLLRRMGTGASAQGCSLASCP